MNLTIIGPGKMGRAIGTRAAAGGHSVTYVGRTIDDAKKAAEEVKASAKNGARVSAAETADATNGDVIILAVPYGTNIELMKQLGSKLKDKIVVDIANPLNSTYDGLATAPDSSSAEEVAKVAAPGTKVVKAFNTTYAGTLLARQVAGQPLDVFIAGDDADAKGKVAQLVKDAGLRPIDAGRLDRARQIESMQLLHITLQNTL
ncbi:MAG TPA: NAD(P)-binding domain-containing protein, partial [Anaerolineales bacterium]|nr:NAD(P)-binding domain-containing protein [Anaerolineales bacterium]